MARSCCASFTSYPRQDVRCLRRVHVHTNAMRTEFSQSRAKRATTLRDVRACKHVATMPASPSAFGSLATKETRVWQGRPQVFECICRIDTHRLCTVYSRGL